MENFATLQFPQCVISQKTSEFQKFQTSFNAQFTLVMCQGKNKCSPVRQQALRGAKETTCQTNTGGTNPQLLFSGTVLESSQFLLVVSWYELILHPNNFFVVRANPAFWDQLAPCPTNFLSTLHQTCFLGTSSSCLLGPARALPHKFF